MIPDLIPIAWLPGCETEFVGLTHGQRQFMGFCLPLPPADSGVPSTPENCRWVALVHLFTLTGAYCGTLYKIHGSLAANPKAREAAAEELQRLLREVGPVQFGDIAVQPFESRIAGIPVGLFVEPTPAGPCCVLRPNDLAFGPPWDGDCVALAAL